ncbi:MAG: T9SS type A sorting domain-containing protein [Flavobacteriales bacterium]|nr:T9SS type A sorting domain-containing protein [Flavobacteriales bacterium]
MKKTLLTLSLAIATIFASAQCTPDAQYTLPGIYPDSATGLPNAIVAQAYNEVITIITPLDTTVMYNGIPLAVTVQTIELTSVTGLPASFTYDCATSNCVFIGGSTSCAVLSSANPLSSEIGLHQIIMSTTTTVDAGIGVPITQDDVIDYYYIDIVDNTTSVVNQFDNTTFNLKDVYPNPVNNTAKIQYISGLITTVEFNIYNLLGEEVESRVISSSRGVNTINVNTSTYSEGMYLYSINNGKQILTKRMIVKN